MEQQEQQEKQVMEAQPFILNVVNYSRELIRRVGLINVQKLFGEDQFNDKYHICSGMSCVSYKEILLHILQKKYSVEKVRVEFKEAPKEDPFITVKSQDINGNSVERIFDFIKNVGLENMWETNNKFLLDYETIVSTDLNAYVDATFYFFITEQKA